MGIRINKVLGYGLTDVQAEDGYISDPRINSNSPLLRGELDVASYIQWLWENFPDDFDANLEIKLIRDSYIESRPLLTYDREGNSNGYFDGVISLRPFGHDNWHRYGDIIDTEEDYALYGDSMDSRATLLKYGIFPYSSDWMDSRTGEKLDRTAARVIKILIDRENGQTERRNAADRLARSLNFDDADHALKYIAPMVPLGIRRLAQWTELFTDSAAWTQLRPMLYVYWS